MSFELCTVGLLANRNRSSMPTNTVNRYSRLCNILLRRQRVSPDLRAKTIDLLGSDADKEAFFKEFEMFDYLRSFYKKRERDRDLYKLALLTGNLAEAIDHAIKSGLDETEPKYVGSVFGYVVAETIFVGMKLITEQNGPNNLMKRASRSPTLGKIVSEWRATEVVLKQVGNMDSSIELSCLQDGLAKNFVSLFVSTYTLFCSASNESRQLHLREVSLLALTLRLCQSRYTYVLREFCISSRVESQLPTDACLYWLASVMSQVRSKRLLL